MPMHNGLLPREGFKMDTIVRALSRTAFNPFFTLPILLLARFTRKGENLSILHQTAFARIRTLFVIGLVRWLSSYYSRGVLNNWTDDQYDWRGKEVVLITGGSGGIGGHVVQFLSEKGIKVVVLDIQPLTFEACTSGPRRALLDHQTTPRLLTIVTNSFECALLPMRHHVAQGDRRCRQGDPRQGGLSYRDHQQCRRGPRQVPPRVDRKGRPLHLRRQLPCALLDHQRVSPESGREQPWHGGDCG